MQFTFNEGHIQLPSQWQDQSMQVLVSTDNSGINLVITREAVPQGTLTPELYQETLALYRQLRKGEQILYFLPSIRI